MPPPVLLIASIAAAQCLEVRKLTSDESCALAPILRKKSQRNLFFFIVLHRFSSLTNGVVLFLRKRRGGGRLVLGNSVSQC